MAIEIGELETRVEAAPARDPGERRQGAVPDPRLLGLLLRRHLSRRARLAAD